MLRSDGPDEQVTVGQLAHVRAIRSQGPRCGVGWALRIYYYFSQLAFLFAFPYPTLTEHPGKLLRKLVRTITPNT